MAGCLCLVYDSAYDWMVHKANHHSILPGLQGEVVHHRVVGFLSEVPCVLQDACVIMVASGSHFERHGWRLSVEERHGSAMVPSGLVVGATAACGEQIPICRSVSAELSA